MAPRPCRGGSEGAPSGVSEGRPPWPTGRVGHSGVAVVLTQPELCRPLPTCRVRRHPRSPHRTGRQGVEGGQPPAPVAHGQQPLCALRVRQVCPN
eukprot:7626073-Alexandrium_andersonii.AAC.1